MARRRPTGGCLPNFDDIEMSDEERDDCIDMCKMFHVTTQQVSDKFLLKLDRHNYVTSTSGDDLHVKDPAR